MTKKSTMTKKKLINSISQEKGIDPNDVRHVIQAFLDKMTECLSGGDRLSFAILAYSKWSKESRRSDATRKKPLNQLSFPHAMR